MFRLLIICILLLPSPIIFAQAEKIDFVSEGVSLHAYLYPGTGSEKKPILLWLHGNPGSKETGSTVWAEALNDLGIHVFKFNYRGLWGNGGDFSLGNALQDLSNAMALLTSDTFTERYAIDTSRIYVGGNSFGSSVAMIGALYHHKMDKVIGVVLCDHSYFGREFMNPNSKIRSFLENAIDGLFLPDGLLNQDREIFTRDLINHNYKYDFVARANQLQDKQLFFYTGINDQVCPVEDHFFPLYRRLQALGHQNVHVMMEEVDHGLNGNFQSIMVEIMSRWIKN